MTDLRTMDNLTLILEYGRAYGNELPGEYKKSLEIELLRRLSLTAPQSEGVGYHIDGIGLGGNNYPIYDKTGIRVGNFQTASTENNKDEILDIMMASVNSHERLTSLVQRLAEALTENNKDEILDIMMASVNSHDHLTSLVRRLAELAREFIDDEVGCTARQYNEVNNSPCSTCPDRKLCQIIAEAGVPDETEGEKNES